MNTETLLTELTLDEKAAIVSGTDFMFTNSVPRLGIPSIEMSDGPHGLRKQKEGGDNGTTNSEPATAFPTAVSTASSWNPDNTFRMGRAIAEECKSYGVHVLLGPGVNIKRNPHAGRNFEYFSEDPYLAGKMAAAEVGGVRSNGVGVSVKHFALNNEEDFRFMGSSVCDMRAMREIYLKVFERVVKEAKPDTIMCAYNQINGTYCSQNGWLLNEVLRGEWGFDGVVMTDWGAMHDRVESLKAGLDLEMPGDTAICRKWIIDGVNDGSLPEDVLDTAVRNVLKLVQKFEDAWESGDAQKTKRTNLFQSHHELAAQIAEDCAVLLKNNGALPLSKNENFLVVGDLFEKMRYQGAGSSMIHPALLTTPKMAFDGHNISYAFAKGYSENITEPQTDLIAEAVEKAKDFDKIVIFAGLTDFVESEGWDRENLMLPANQLLLIQALTAASIKPNQQLIVVLYGGSVVELPFADSVNAILHMFLPGQNGGTATYHLLFGDKTPCGKLSETWVKQYEDVPFGANFSKDLQEVYKESIFVGYRYYLTAKKEVRYPFGYGLSYTTFSYRDLNIEQKDGAYTVTCTVQNTGSYDGAEIVQLYVKAPASDVFKPEKELRAFTKVYLKAGEETTAVLTFEEEDLRYWDIVQNHWVLEDGAYEIQICSDCMSVQLAQTVQVNGEKTASPYSARVRDSYRCLLSTQSVDTTNVSTAGKCSSDIQNKIITNDIWEEMSSLTIPALPPKKPITLESRFSDLQQTFMGRILFNAVLSVANSQMKKAKKMPEGAEKDNCTKGAVFLKKILESNSLLSMSMCAGSIFPYNFAQGFVHLANGHFIKGIKSFLRKLANIHPL